MKSLKRWLRRLRTLLWTAFALVIIGAAVLVGVGKLLMPYSERYKPRLEAVLSEEFNQPVQLEGFTGEWKAFGPRISLEGVTLLGGDEGQGDIAIRRAALDIKPLNALISGRPLYSFEIIGADLTLTRDAEGRFELSGLGLSGRQVEESESSGGLQNLARLGEVRLQGSSFSYRDVAQDIDMQLTSINGRLQMAGNQLSLQVRASLSNARRNRILGDFSTTVLAEISDENQLDGIEFHVESGELIMEELTARLPQEALRSISGRLNAQVWGSWAPETPLELAGVVDLRDTEIPAEGKVMSLEHLNVRLAMTLQEKAQWRLDVADMSVTENGRQWVAPAVTIERNLPGNLAVWVSAQFVEAEFPLEVTIFFMKTFGINWPGVVPTAGRGPVRDFELVINGNRKLAAVSGSFEGLEVMEWARYPLVRGLDGRIDLAFGEGSLWFSGEDVLVRWPRNFRSTLSADIPECELEILWTEDSDYQVDAQRCSLSNEDLDLQADLRFKRDVGKPRALINALISAPDVSRLHDYWPQSIMSPKVTDWLRRSVRSGSTEGARLVIEGDLDAFPFPNRDGVMLAEARLVGVDLDYSVGWPMARGIDADLRFDGPAVTVSGRIGDIAGSEVQAAKAQIDDLKAPEMVLDYESSTDLGLLKQFLAATPMLDNAELELDPLGFSGPATIQGTLRIPFGERSEAGEEVTVSGALELQSSSFEDARTGFRLENLVGQVPYDRETATAAGLTGTLGGWPAQLDLQAAWNTDQPFLATLEGVFPASLVISETPLADDPLLARVHGDAKWVATLDSTRDKASGATSLNLDLESDLQGVALDLPPPLNKPVEGELPLTVRYPLGQDVTELLLQLGDRLEMRVELEQVDASASEIPEGPSFVALDDPAESTASESQAESPPAPAAETEQAQELILRRAAVALGEPAQLPAPGGLMLSGQAAQFNLDDWIEVASLYEAAGVEGLDVVLLPSSLRTDELIMLNRPFMDVSLGLELEGTTLISRFDSEDLAGTVRYARNASGIQSLSADLERMYMPDSLEEEMRMDADPTALPEMHFFIQDLRYLGLNLGETRIEAFPIGDGLRIESLDARSSQLTLQARGDWVESAEGSRSDFDIVLTSESLGELVTALDISSVLEGGQTMVRYDAWWPGPPGAFNLARLNGEMTFSVIDGRILNADPGAGRVLGLMSVGALPRRLALDFSDVFDSGFGFDQASGTIALDSGTAYTDDFLLESTAAKLHITGSTDLVAQEFNHQMTIRPGVSQALPVIGAIAGGPAGAAAGLALQGILRNALGEATEARYEIKGPWEDPEVIRQENPSGRSSRSKPAEEPVPETNNSTVQATTTDDT